MLTLVGFGTAKLRRPIRLPSWVGFAVAVELPAGLLRLFLIGQPSHSRTRIYPLAAASLEMGPTFHNPQARDVLLQMAHVLVFVALPNERERETALSRAE